MDRQALRSVRLSAGAENMGRTEAAADDRLREELAAAHARTDADFRLKHRVAPVRQGPAGVLAYLLHEAERPGEVHAPDTRPEPRARGGSGVPDVTASYDPGSLPHQPP